ncbi:MAG: PTS fructose-like transporter subunit IIB [Chloroflexaceae bacterium]|nr:PTS fructose-like transporter subunit IIB [Chloroflexaceae bacterium]
MIRIAAITACPTGVAHTMMAAEALKKTGRSLGYEITVETQGSAGAKNVLSPQAIANADVIILAADIRVDPARFGEKPIYETRTSEAIRNTESVIKAALALVNSATQTETTPVHTAAVAPEPVQAPVHQATGAKKLVGVTSCPTGIAHTFMAAEALQKAARALGHSIKVETRGSVGAQNALTDEEIAEADAVVIAADTKVDTERFAGKPVYTTSTKQAMHHGQDVITAALVLPVGQTGSSAPTAHYADSVKQAKSAQSQGRTGPYKHLMTGVSYMLPIVVAGGLSIALAFAIGGIQEGAYPEGSLAAALMQIGGGTAFGLFVAVLSGFIAYSIADRPGLAPGLIGGMLAQSLGAGFLGGIVSGFLAGYLTKFLAENIKLPANLEGLKPVLILPFLSTITVGLLMIYVIAPPVQVVLNTMTDWLNGMQSANAIVLGLILGAMMAFDMGGPINKAAYTFAVALLTSQVYGPMAAVMAAGMTPPLGLALAGFLFPNRFADEEREARGPALVLGISFITEGAIPFAAKDPFRVIPSLMAGSAVAAALSMLWQVELLVPHGGIFALLIPNAVTNLFLYLLAIIIGAFVTVAALFVLKRPIGATSQVAGQPKPVTSV